MPAKMDLTGKRFGRIEVIREDGRNRHGQIKWYCKCDCGKNKTILGNHLRNREVNSCGCLRNEKASARTKLRLAGKKFGRLRVVREYGRSGQPIKWYCKCDCGNTTVTLATSLQKGRVNSCGCLRKLANLARAKRVSVKGVSLTANMLSHLLGTSRSYAMRRINNYLKDKNAAALFRKAAGKP